jgi:hypothetical protein
VMIGAHYDHLDSRSNESGANGLRRVPC